MISRADVKLIKALKLKKYRTKERKFLVEGIKSVNELLKSDFRVSKVFVSENVKHEIHETSELTIVDNDAIRKNSTLKNNEDCFAIAHIPERDETKLLDHAPMIVLDGIQDPGNLGTIIRTLDWFGFDRIYCSDDCVDFYNPKVIVSTMGSFTRVIPHYLSLSELFSTHEDIPVYGLDMSGTSLNKASIDVPSFFVLGSESSGIRSETAKRVSQFLSIPGSGKAESLNVSITAGILIHHLFIGYD